MHYIPEGRHVIGGKFHYKWRGIAGEHLCFLKHYSRNNDSRHPGEISAGRYPPRPVEQSRGYKRDNRKLCAARDKSGSHNGHSPIPLIFNGTACHYSRYAAARSYKHGNKWFSRKSELTEYFIHYKCNARHIAAGFKKRKQDKQHHHLRQEAQYRAYTRDYSIQQQAFKPTRAVYRVKPIFGKDRNTRYPYSVIGSIGNIFPRGFRHSRKIKAVLTHNIAVALQRFGKGVVITVFYGGIYIFRS